MAELVDKKTGSRSTKEIFEECRKYSMAERRQICEEFIKDVETLSDRMHDLFDVNPGVFMMYGVSVELKVTFFNEDSYTMRLGNSEFYDTVVKMSKDVSEGKNDKRA